MHVTVASSGGVGAIRLLTALCCSGLFLEHGNIFYFGMNDMVGFADWYLYFRIALMGIEMPMLSSFL